MYARDSENDVDGPCFKLFNEKFAAGGHGLFLSWVLSSVQHQRHALGRNKVICNVSESVVAQYAYSNCG
jgi:hypothetical protein